jgi:hypothetical protein
LLVSTVTVASWMHRLDEEGPDADVIDYHPESEDTTLVGCGFRLGSRRLASDFERYDLPNR